MKKIFAVLLGLPFFACNNSQNNAEISPKIEDVYEVVFENSELKIEDLYSPTSESLRGISVVNDSVAWFSGANGTILKTTDGGENIYFLEPPFRGDVLDFRDIYAFDIDSAVLINSGIPGVVYRTNDKGRSWKKVFNFPIQEIFYDAVEFVNDQYGLVYSDPVNGKHFILVSGIYGLRWLAPPAENLIPALEGEAAFAASGSSIAFAPNKRAFIGLGGPKGRILTSKLPYKDWEAIETPIFQGAPTRGIYSITFKNDSIGVAVGGDYTLPDSMMVENSIYTQDGGKTWLNPQTPLSGYRSCVAYCGPANTFVAIGTNGIDISKDNGVNWTRIPNFEKGLNSIQFVENRKFGYMIGSKGEIYKITIY